MAYYRGLEESKMKSDKDKDKTGFSSVQTSNSAASSSDTLSESLLDEIEI